MEKTSSPGLARTKSDQLVETIAAAFKSPVLSGEAPTGVASSDGAGVGATLSRKSSRRVPMAASPGRSSVSGKNNTHIRKCRSAQLKLDLDEVNSCAALSRASSASLGFSFSFTGFTLPADDIDDSKPFSDDDISK